jgi:hypothetical protein
MWASSQGYRWTTPATPSSRATSTSSASTGGGGRAAAGVERQLLSGIHKELPTEADLADNPDALARLEEWFGEDPNRPLRRPFDAMHRLGLGDKSDYDVNISHDGMVAKARAVWEAGDFKGDFIINHRYLNKSVAEKAFEHVQKWSGQWTSRLGRDVSHAVFGSTGPYDTSGIGSGISVHFRPDDWKVSSPGVP